MSFIQQLKKYPSIYYNSLLVYRFKKRMFERKNAWEKINNILYQFDRNYLNKPKPIKSPMPKAALIEVTNACNLNCVMCNIKISKRPVGYLAPHVFEKILDQLKKINIDNIMLHSLGETFMYKDLESLFDIAKKKNFKVKIRTNAQFPKKIEQYHKRYPNLVNSFSFSIDAVTKKNYEFIREGGKVERVHECLEVVNKINKGKRDSRISLDIYSTLSMTNIKEVKLFFDNFITYCYPDKINFELLYTVSTVSDFINKASPWSNLVIKNIPCTPPFNFIYFTNEGNVTLCCRDFEDELVVGDIMENTIQEIWNGHTTEEIRYKHLNPEKMDIDVCNGCYHVYPEVNSIVNEFIHVLYMSNPKMDADVFGDRIINLLMGMDSAIGEKNFDKLKTQVLAAFDDIN